MYVCIYIYVYICMYVCIYVYLYVMHVYIYASIHLSIRPSIYLPIYLSIKLTLKIPLLTRGSMKSRISDVSFPYFTLSPPAAWPEARWADGPWSERQREASRRSRLARFSRERASWTAPSQLVSGVCSKEPPSLDRALCKRSHVTETEEHGVDTVRCVRYNS